MNPGSNLIPAARGWLAGAVVLCAAGALLFRSPALAQETQQQKFGETVVSADTIEYDFGTRQVLATGNVELVSGNSRLTAERMTVQMTPNRTLDWARCEGKVVVERKNPEQGTTTTARSQTLNYSESTQKADLQGDVVVHLESPRLERPAVLTGARADLDLKSGKHVLTGSQAKVNVQPKGEEGKPKPEPLDLLADRIEMDANTQEYVATGKPQLVRPTSRLTARRIRFQVDEKANEVKVAYAEQDVVFDGQGENGSVIHTTADQGVFNREVNELVLTGKVQASVREKGEERPTLYQGRKWTYNTKTRANRLEGGIIVVPETKVRPSEPPKDPKPDPKSGDPKNGETKIGAATGRAPEAGA